MKTAFTGVDVAALLRIAGEVGEVVQDLHQRRAYILDGLLGLIGGCSAVCSEIDPGQVHGDGWAVPSSITVAGGLSTGQQDMIDRYLTGHLAALDPCVPSLLREPKPVATIRREDVVEDLAWYRSDHYNEVRRPLGFGESMYGKLVTPDGRHLKLSLHRELNDSPFTERDARLLHVFNENLAGLYIAPPHADAPRHDAQLDTLPARVRPVLRRLLAGDSEKQVANKLDLSPHTVHEYTKVLYRTFGVNSRGELLAQFVDDDYEASFSAPPADHAEEPYIKR
jgi:DNA-binding CsgD family transcriptional regulator